MKLKSVLKNQPTDILEEILTFWNILPLTFDEQIDDEQRRELLSEYLYPRLQQPHYFSAAYQNLSSDEQDLIFFLAIHGGDLEKQEVLQRFFANDEEALTEMLDRMTQKGFVFLEDLGEEMPGTVLVGLPEAYLRFIELPSYWEG
jgi:hypothetical protein